MPFEVGDTICVVRDLPASSAGREETAGNLVVAIPAAGCPARVVARKLDLAVDGIRGVLVHHQIYSLDHHLQPGDEVAFIPADASAVIAARRHRLTVITKTAH